MSLQLGDLLLQLALHLRVQAHAFGHQVPFQRHDSLQSSHVSRFTLNAYFRLMLSTERKSIPPRPSPPRQTRSRMRSPLPFSLAATASSALRTGFRSISVITSSARNPASAELES